MHTDSKRVAGSIGVFAVLAAAITTVSLLAGGADPASATDLTRFASCGDMRTWIEDLQGDQFAREEAFASGDDAATESVAGAPPASAPAADGAAPRSVAQDEDGGIGGGDAGTGGTNTVVEGVDEIDIVDRLPGGRALVARSGVLSLVDLDSLTVLDSHRGLPHDARLSVGGDVVWVAGSEQDGSGVEVTRLRLAGDTLETDGEWTTPGWLVDARRTGDRLHVLAVDQPHVAGAIPFEGGPVPCDQVWRPEGGAHTPAATLLATLPAEGALQPTATAEVVGAGGGFLVTDTAAYVTTQTWDGTPETGVHRFDLATLSPTGSGRVPGTVPGPFGLSEHDGHLRVATNGQPQFRGDIVMSEPATDVVRDTPAVGTSESGPLAEVFVLDLDGALDLVGRTGLFGHDGETIHGIRFVGDTAYVVTFLQTDPFWVLDLSDPKAPRTVGELEIPGFSGYLHPVDDTRVVGFGPDGEGKVAARLFDVSDHAKPTLVDQVTLGGESPVVWDHHAYVATGGGRFAVPVNEHPTYVRDECVGGPVPLPSPEPEPRPLPVEPGIGDGASSSSPTVAPDGRNCQPVFAGGSAGVTVLAVQAGRLVVADERTFDSSGEFLAERVLPTSDGEWVLVGYDRLVNPDGGQLVLPI